MHYPRPSPPWWRGKMALAGLLAAALLLGPARASAQEMVDLKLGLQFGFKQDPAKDRPGNIDLRPNVPQEVFVFVTNDTGEEQTATVEVLSGGAVQLSQVVNVKKDGLTRVGWEKAPAAKKALPGDLSFRLKNKEGKLIKGGVRRLEVARPYTYLSPKATYAPATDTAPSLFELTLEQKKGDTRVSGGPAKVELDVSPANIEKLVPDQPKAGRYSGFFVLGAVNAFLSLQARGLVFAESATDPEGTIYVTVDGFKRAIIADTTFARTGGEGKVDIRDAARMSLPLPRYSLPKALKVPVYADGNIAWSDRVRVQVSAGAKKEKVGDEEKLVPQWATVAEFKGPRQVKHSLAAGPEGGLVFAPAVTDWVVELDFSGVFDKTEVRLQVLPAGVTDEKNAKDLYDGVTRRPSGKSVVQGIIFDASAPTGVEFVRVPAVAYRGREIEVYATAADKESGISEVFFYLGKPAEGGKLAPGIVKVPGIPVDSGSDTTEFWKARFLVPPDAKGPFLVAVQAVNGVGLASARALELPVTDAPPELASVRGQVFEKDVPVENIPVVLLSDTGVELAITRTGAGGKYEFPAVKPGAYAVYSRRELTGFRKTLPFLIKGREQLTGVDLLLEAPPTELKEKEKPKKTLGSIKGVVVEGPRRQAGVLVQLVDPPSRRQIKATRTNAEGAYAFKDLPKGNYIVVATRSASLTRAERPVELDTGEDKAGVDMKLFR